MFQKIANLVLLFGLIGISFASLDAQIVVPSDKKMTDSGKVKSTKKGFDVSRLFTGGGLGLSFGTVTYVEISPLLGYYFTEKFAAGAGVTWQYTNNKQYSPAYSTSVFGPRAFARYDIIENLFAQVEFENLTYKDNFDTKINLSRLPIGAGYRQRMGGNSFLNILGMYDLLHDSDSLYSSPWIIRGGVNIGF